MARLLRGVLLLFVAGSAFATPRRLLGNSDECAQGFNGETLDTTNPLASPDRPRFKLPMCRMYNEESCCAPIHDSTVADCYTHLVDVGERCLDFYNHKHSEIRQYFCIFCDPNHLEYMECCSEPLYWNGEGDKATSLKTADEVEALYAADDSVDYFYESCGDSEMYGEGSCDSTGVNSIRICQSWADDMWGDDGSHFDECGMSVFSGSDASWDNPAGVVFWGDVDGTTGDGGVLPSKNWDTKQRFFRDTKPPMFDPFLVRVVPDSEGNCFNSGVALSPSSLSMIIVALVSMCMVYLF